MTRHQRNVTSDQKSKSDGLSVRAICSDVPFPSLSTLVRSLASGVFFDVII